jgi:hypothetical protein
MTKKKRSPKVSKLGPAKKRRLKDKSTGIGSSIAAASGSAAGTGGAAAFAKPLFPLRVGERVINPAALDPAMTPPGVGAQSGGDALRAGAVTPTIYPDSPLGLAIVQNYVAINFQTEEFGRFNKNIEALLAELRQSNEISGELRDQLVSELRAGREIISGPKPQRDLLDLLLVKPLKWLAEKSGTAIVSKLAADALGWLLKMIGAI